MKRFLVAVLVAAVSVSLGAGVASAHRVIYKSTVSIKFTTSAYGDSFSGKVRSPRARCVKRRSVRVFRVATGPDTVIGTDTSSDTGAWVVNPGGFASPGDYYAKAKRKVLKRNARHRHICRGATSRTIHVG